jgi:hypothetical protein
MDTLEHVIELSHLITSLRRTRGELEAQIATVDEELAKVLADLKKYVSGATNGNGKQGRGPTGYKKGSVAHRILVALAASAEGMTGAELTATIGAENRQVHALLSRLAPLHVTRTAGEGRNSKYVITGAGREALANAREGGSSDDTSSTAPND